MTALGRILISLLTLRYLARGFRMPCFVMFGAVAGAGLFVFHASRATSYLSDSPETCVNCHLMNTAYTTWQHSSHGRVTNCNDCHVPHDTLLRKFAFKARDGLWHSTVFTMRWEPECIRISAGAVPVVEENCRRCHAKAIEDVSIAAHQQGDLRCWDCHREVPHGTVRSLSTAPTVFRPDLPELTTPGQTSTVGGRPPRPEK